VALTEELMANMVKKMTEIKKKHISSMFGDDKILCGGRLAEPKPIMLDRSAINADFLNSSVYK